MFHDRFELWHRGNASFIAKSEKEEVFFLSLVVILRLWGNKCGNVAMQKKEESPADAEQEEEKGA